MTFAEGFYQYFRDCPLIPEKKLSYNYHEPKAGDYFIVTDSPDAKLSQYLNGNSIWQKPIYFCMMGTIGQDSKIQIDNSIEFEEFREWVEEKNSKKELPTLPDFCYPISLQCTTDGYANETQTNTAIYQIQMTLTYQRNIRR